MSKHEQHDENFIPGFLRGRLEPPSSEELAVLRERFVKFTKTLFPHLYGNKHHNSPLSDEQRENLREEYMFFLGRYPEQFDHSVEGFTFFNMINSVLQFPAPFCFDDVLRVLVSHDHSKDTENE